MSGKMLLYALAEPIETDITEQMLETNMYLDIEPEGSVRFHNEYIKAVPSIIKYVIDIGG